jgi:hypothetical protein
MNPWEQQFIRTFTAKHKRERYLGFLSNPKRRDKLIHELNNGLELEPSLATHVPNPERTKSGLLGLLKARGATGSAHVMALQHELDGGDLPLEEAIDVLLTSPWGVLLICPPRPVALYKAEDPGGMTLLCGPPSGSTRARLGADRRAVAALTKSRGRMKRLVRGTSCARARSC